VSTRSVIARWTHGDDWRGVYCHWDGYPSGVGATLWRIYRAPFGCNLSAMLKLLIDDHPEGWSAIVNCDFALQPTWTDTYAAPNVEAQLALERYPQAYKYRGETEPMLSTRRDDTWCEWAYVFSEDYCTMTIQKRVYVAWCDVDVLNLDGLEPDWEAY